MRHPAIVSMSTTTEMISRWWYYYATLALYAVMVPFVQPSLNGIIHRLDNIGTCIVLFNQCYYLLCTCTNDAHVLVVLSAFISIIIYDHAAFLKYFSVKVVRVKWLPYHDWRAKCELEMSICQLQLTFLKVLHHEGHDIC